MSHDDPVICHECEGAVLPSRTIRHPDDFRMCVDCFWVEMNYKLEMVMNSDSRFERIKRNRLRVSLYIANTIGREQSLLWEPKEILKGFMRDVLKLNVSNPPENRRAKIGKVTWI